MTPIRKKSSDSRAMVSAILFLLHEFNVRIVSHVQYGITIIFWFLRCACDDERPR